MTILANPRQNSVLFEAASCRRIRSGGTKKLFESRRAKAWL